VNETDFVVEAGTTATSDATNLVPGHASNAVTVSAVGATVEAELDLQSDAGPATAND